MHSVSSVKQFLVLVTLWVGVLSLSGQSPSNATVRVSAQVQTNPSAITLSWPANPGNVTYKLFRKLRDDSAWGEPLVLAGNVTSYVDTNVVVGGAYEYQIQIVSAVGFYAGEGDIYAGIEVPLVESRGKVILIVDNTHATALAAELTRLQQDLVGDGWMVLRHDVPRTVVEPANTSSNVWSARAHELAYSKGLIKADYNADPSNVKAVFLFGHVPVPYSGDLYPDGHPDHRGAWPADGFYGDMDGNWTDTNVNRITASDPRNRNVPGDGKFDQTAWPVPNGSFRFEVELAVGRVDLAHLPAFGQSEKELLRQYLNKDHQFRHKGVAVERRGLIDDNFGYLNGEVPAVNGWRNFAAFFGASNTFAGDWLTTLSTQSYLWGYGCGGGTYTSAAGIATTAQLVNSDPRVVFTMLFGSYFGDWDSQNNLLRASLATSNYTLTSAWVARPHWHFHHMALGEPIGFSTRLTQNNDGTFYSSGGFGRAVHVALMGDPTLRMHPVAPPSNLEIAADGLDVELKWNPSLDEVVGYAVYRAAAPGGPYTRLNSAFITGTNYTVADSTETNYMVKAVKLELSGSGSYYNSSQGVFAVAEKRPTLALSFTNGSYQILGDGVPGRVYRIEFIETLGTTNWQTAGAVTGDASGLFLFRDSPTSSQRFYRSVLP